jgi:hypothetical protein
MLHYCYILEGGRYVFYQQGCALFATSEVALLLNKEHGHLLKHGLPYVVGQELAKAQAAFVAAGMCSDDVVVIQGKFNIAELNRVLRDEAYVRELYARWMAEREAIIAPQVNSLLQRIGAAAR